MLFKKSGNERFFHEGTRLAKVFTGNLGVLQAFVVFFEKK